MPAQTLTPEILAAALQGLEAQRERIESQLAAVRRLMRDGSKAMVAPPVSAASTPTDGDPRPRRKLSARARKRIGEAQKKRWAAFHKQSGKPPATDKKPARGATSVKATPSEAPVRKRKMSAAGRKRIIEATKKRWAAFHKAQRSAAAKRATPISNQISSLR
jgi:hypothetical protein